MKRSVAVPFLALLFMLGACSARYYQIYEVKGNNVVREDGYLVFRDENCSVLYNFWGNGGFAGFTVVNNTDSILYIDMAKSFFTRNGMTFDYFEDAVYVSGSGKSSFYADGPLGFSVSRRNYGGGRNGAGTTEVYNVDAYGLSGESPSRYRFTVRQERPVLLLPPRGARMISKFVLWNSAPYSDDECGKDLVPAEKVSQAYSVRTSPLVFSNFITYSVGERGKPVHIDNLFYVSEITNMTASEALTEESYRCEGEYYPRTVGYIKDMDAARFYIEYER